MQNKQANTIDGVITSMPTNNDMDTMLNKGVRIAVVFPYYFLQETISHLSSTMDGK